jgi:ceramide glucosyltransferase
VINIEIESINLIISIITVISFLEVLRSHNSMSLAIQCQRISLPLSEYPSVSIIRPIKGLDVNARDNIVSSLEHGYEGDIEILFIFDDESEPAIPIVKESLSNYPEVNARIIYSGQPKQGWTGKLNAMLVAYEHAEGDLIAFADSDIQTDERTLSSLVECIMGSDQIGASFAPVVGINKSETWGDAGYNMMLNGLYAPALSELVLKSDNELSFVMGQFMIFKREALESIGGIKSAKGQLVDDMYLGSKVAEAGYYNSVSSHPVSIVQSNLSFGNFWSIFKRWIAFSRSGLSSADLKFKSWIRGLIFWFSLIGTIFYFSIGNICIFSMLVITNLSLNISIIRLHSVTGGSHLKYRYWFIVPFLFLSAPIIYFSIFFNREVEWRGRNYSLRSDAKLTDEE